MRAALHLLPLLLAWIPALAAAQGAAAGRALGPAAVLVSPRDPGAADAALAAERALAFALRADGRLAVVDLDAKLGVASAGLPEAAERLEAGKKAFDESDLATAAREFLACLKLMMAHPECAGPAEVAEVLTLLGASFTLKKDDARASASFRRAAVFAPGFTPSGSTYPPGIAAAFQSARVAVANGPKGGLTVTASAPLASVVVGGVDQGPAPAMLKDLPAGRHHVLVRARGYEPFAQLVDVAEGAESSLSAELEPLPGAAHYLRASAAATSELTLPGVSSGARELGAAVGARYLLVASAQSETLAGAVLDLVAYDLAAGRQALALRKTVTPESPEFPGQMRTLATAAVDALLKEDAAFAAASPEAAPITQRWWFWPAVGTAAAAAATTAAILVANSLRRPGLVITGVP